MHSHVIALSECTHEKQNFEQKRRKTQKIKSSNSEGISQLKPKKNLRKKRAHVPERPEIFHSAVLERKKETKRSLKLEFKNVLFVRIHTISIYQSLFVRSFIQNYGKCEVGD